MRKGSTLVAGVVLLYGAHGLSLAAGIEPVPFATATVRFETNVTDNDVEIVFEAKGGDEGLSRLIVKGPDGRTVVDAAAPDASTMGLRQFVFESPEPRDVAALKAAYPEGSYTFTGATSDGKQFIGKATLSHALPAAVSILHPGKDAKGVNPRKLTLEWSAVPGAARYTLEIEQEDSAAQVKATLPGTVTHFAVPVGFLRPGEDYKIAIGSVMMNGNMSVVETEFETAD